jgi:hypothetical protein
MEMSWTCPRTWQMSPIIISKDMGLSQDNFTWESSSHVSSGHVLTCKSRWKNCYLVMRYLAIFTVPKIPVVTRTWGPHLFLARISWKRGVPSHNPTTWHLQHHHTIDSIERHPGLITPSIHPSPTLNAITSRVFEIETKLIRFWKALVEF